MLKMHSRLRQNSPPSVAVIILTLVLYRFTSRLGSNISKLRIFAYKADHNESLEVEDLASFPVSHPHQPPPACS